MTDRFQKLLHRRKEGRHLEYKGSHEWGGGFRGKLTKEIIGMSNTRDGGTIIIGVAEGEESDKFILEGMQNNHLESYDEDSLRDWVDERVDPFVRFSLNRYEINGEDFLEIKVEEFEEIPVICSKSFSNILSEPKIYIRSTRKPETIEVPGQTEMRELLQLAIDKSIRRYRIRESRRTPEVSASDRDQYDEEIEDLL